MIDLPQHCCYSEFQVINSEAFRWFWSWKSIFFLNSEKIFWIPTYLTRFSVNLAFWLGVFQELKKKLLSIKTWKIGWWCRQGNPETRQILSLTGRCFMKIGQIHHAETPYLARTLVNMKKFRIFFSEFKNIDFQLHNQRNAAE